MKPSLPFGPTSKLVRPCRVCGLPVGVWRKGVGHPHTTIHRECLEAVCKFCGVTFSVAKERKGLFCCREHFWSFLSFGCRSAAEAEKLGRTA